jgi:alpha-L-arabinofuranosidase
MIRRTSAILFVFIFGILSCRAQSVITVQADKPLAEIQPTMWGIFFEDINYGADGGLYPELVKNRSFEFDTPLMGWKAENYDKFSTNLKSGEVLIVNRGVDEQQNFRFARISVNDHNPFAIVNEGFFGMGFKKDVKYDFSLDARVVEGTPEITAELLNNDNRVVGSVKITSVGKSWKKYSASVTPTETVTKGKLRLVFSGKSTTDIDLISLFPTDTWKSRPRGLRADLVQKLYDLKPGFLRFPGGCIVEGRDLSQRYQWKTTVGDPDDRKLIVNRWNTEFRHRPSPDYYQSFGLGFFEYFQLAEDLGASPLPILSCGMACQFNTAEVVPLEQLDPYVQDALDLIEFANGAVTTRWGKLRSDMGHPQPFNLTMIGVGNEQWGEQYIDRYKVFAQAIKSKYPEIKIVSGTGPFPDGELFDYAAGELKKLNAEIVDEHYYRAPGWFLQNATRYDHYDRSGPKIFAGEYAAQSKDIASTENKNNWECALSEAAFMTGLERNADVVHLASYAPLFAHAEGWQWTPDLIWFDNLDSYATPNYYVQKLFSNNRGTHTLATLLDGKKVTGQNGLYASAVVDKKTKEVIIKIVNADKSAQQTSLQLSGGSKYDSKVTITTLSGELNGVNSFSNPAAIQPSESTLTLKGKTLSLTLAPSSLSVVKIKMK